MYYFSFFANSELNLFIVLGPFLKFIKISTRRVGAFVSTLFLSIAFQLPLQADLTQGLVAWYPFDGNASDMSGNGNHGTVYGATLGTDRHGHANKAYNFDGVDDYILITNGSYTHPSQTIAFWLKPLELNTGQYIFDQQPFDNRSVIIGSQSGKLNIFDSSYPTGNALDTAV